MKGSDMICSSAPWRDDTNGADAVVEHEKRLEIVVRHAIADRRDRRVELRIQRVGIVEFARGRFRLDGNLRLRQHVAGRALLVSGGHWRHQVMAVRGTLRTAEGDARRPAGPAQVIIRSAGELTLPDRDVALHVRQTEVGRAVAAKPGAEQREQFGVLVDGDDLPLALLPVDRRELETEDRNLAKKWFCHDGLPPKNDAFGWMWVIGWPVKAGSGTRLTRR